MVSVEQIRELQVACRAVRVEESISEYILDIVAATRAHEELTLGVSTRGALTFYRAAQGFALASGRDYVTPDDVKTLAGPVLSHRVVCRGLLREGQRQRASQIITQVVDSTVVPV